MEEANLRSDKLKWDSTNLSFERDKTCGYSWPQRNYPCAFCKKQFKSAQALGGHMNIHRRERAQLRSLNLSPNPLDYPNPNPNPKPTFLPYASCLTSLTPSLASALSSKSSDPNIDEETMLLLKPHSHQLDQRQKMRNEEFLGFGKLKGFTEEDEVCEFRVLKKNEGLELGLGLGMGMGMGLLRDGEGDLDLELRLGLS